MKNPLRWATNRSGLSEARQSALLPESRDGLKTVHEFRDKFMWWRKPATRAEMLVLLLLVLIGLGWDAHQQSRIEALPDVVERLEQAVDRLDGMKVTAEGGDSVILMRTDPGQT